MYSVWPAKWFVTLVHWSCNSYHMCLFGPLQYFSVYPFMWPMWLSFLFMWIIVNWMVAYFINKWHNMRKMSHLYCTHKQLPWFHFVSWQAPLSCTRGPGDSISRKSSYLENSQSLEGVRSGIKCSYHFNIWQAPRQQYCQDACQISEQLENSDHRSRAFEALRDFVVPMGTETQTLHFNGSVLKNVHGRHQRGTVWLNTTSNYFSAFFLSAATRYRNLGLWIRDQTVSRWSSGIQIWWKYSVVLIQISLKWSP